MPLSENEEVNSIAIVQKSQPLMSLWESEFTLGEFKLLDTYLSRINSHEPDKRTITFGKGELEKMFNIKRIREEVLEERLEHLMKPVTIKEKNGFVKIILFERATALKENECWNISMTCSESAMKYMFNVESLGYLRYKLKCITSLTSRYTYIMFLYIENNKKMHKEWTVSTDRLREILNCKKEDIYNKYKYFNEKILQKVKKEIEEKTDLRYEYEPIRSGRSTKYIRIKVTSKENEIEQIESKKLDKIETDENEIIEKCATAMSNSFSKEQITTIAKETKCSTEEMLDAHEYMMSQVKKGTTIENAVAYMIKCIQKHYYEVTATAIKGQPKKTSTHNFQQHDYAEELSVSKEELDKIIFGYKKYKKKTTTNQ